MRVLRALVGAALLLALAVPSVAAGKPERAPFLNPGELNYAAGEACSFPLKFETVLQAEYGITFFDPDGNPTRTLISGRLIARLTNVDSGASVTVNVSGPGEFVYNADGTISATLRGQSILIPPGVSMYLHNGPMQLLIGTDGVPTLISQSGTGFDPCSLID